MNSTPIYWTCRKCNNIGVVYSFANDNVYDVVNRIECDHDDATEDTGCKLDLAELNVSRTPDERHIAAEREADEAEAE